MDTQTSQSEDGSSPKLSDGGTLPFRIMTDNGAEPISTLILDFREGQWIHHPIPIKYGNSSSDDANEVVLPNPLKGAGLTDETYSKATLTYEGRDYKIVGLLSVLISCNSRTLTSVLSSD